MPPATNTTRSHRSTAAAELLGYGPSRKVSKLDDDASVLVMPSALRTNSTMPGDATASRESAAAATTVPAAACFSASPRCCEDASLRLPPDVTGGRSSERGRTENGWLSHGRSVWTV